MDEWLDRVFRADIPAFDELSRIDLQFVKHRPAYYLALDLGYSRDHAALVILEYRATPTGTRDAATYQFLYRRELPVDGSDGVSGTHQPAMRASAHLK